MGEPKTRLYGQRRQHTLLLHVLQHFEMTTLEKTDYQTEQPNQDTRENVSTRLNEDAVKQTNKQRNKQQIGKITDQ